MECSVSSGSLDYRSVNVAPATVKSALLQRVIAASAALPIAAVVILLYPVRRYRFGVFPLDEIGPLARNPHHYVWDKFGARPKTTSDWWVFRPDTFVSNAFVVDQWRQKINIKEGWFYWYLSRIVLTIGGNRHVIAIKKRWSDFPSRDHEFLIRLDEVQSKEASSLLKQIGIVPGVDFITLCVRDSSYKKVFRREPLLADVKESYRNNDISDFTEMAEVVSASGVSVVRMGVAVQEPFRVDVSGVIDYATSRRRTEMLDVHLMSNCKLCVSTSLGVDQLSAMSGRPRCIINLFPYKTTASFYSWDTVTVQRLRNGESGPELSLRESLDLLTSRQFRGMGTLDDAGVSLIRLTPAEIREVVMEALNEGPDHQVLSRSDQNLQDRYWEILYSFYSKVRVSPALRPRISPTFLRRCEWWLT